MKSTEVALITGSVDAPRQESCPHPQSTSTLSSIPSQWALQYFCFSGGIQLQAALAQVLTSVIGSP
jgi:hypothetical protein